MIKLETLPGLKGEKQKRKRVGRGEGSGLGKTSGRGHKGAGARSGNRPGVATEGGQTPLQRRLPKRGFKRAPWTVATAALNLSQIAPRFEEGASVDLAALRAAGLVPKAVKRFKVLGEGEIDKKLVVVADGFSASARRKIEAAGGACHPVKAPAETPGE